MTPVGWAISTYRHPSWESLTMSCNISPEIWCGTALTLQNRGQKVVSSDGIRVNLAPFVPSVDLPPWLLMNLLIQSSMTCIRRAIPCRNPCRPLPEIGAICLEINYSQSNQFCSQLNKNLPPKKKYSNGLAEFLCTGVGPCTVVFCVIFGVTCCLDNGVIVDHWCWYWLLGMK